MPSMVQQLIEAGQVQSKPLNLSEAEIAQAQGQVPFAQVDDPGIFPEAQIQQRRPHRSDTGQIGSSSGLMGHHEKLVRVDSEGADASICLWEKPDSNYSPPGFAALGETRRAREESANRVPKRAWLRGKMIARAATLITEAIYFTKFAESTG